jgi:septal ring factor EnvC (AmiA/AmiB activator)
MFRSYGVFACLLVLLPSIALAQRDATEAQSLKSIADEIHQLRRELKTVSVLSQRVQIALYRLHNQETAVDHARERAENARLQLGNIRSNEREVSHMLQQTKDTQLRSTDPVEQRHLDDVINDAKSRLDLLAQDEREAQASETQADNELRTEETKLDSLQDLLDGLDKSLAALDTSQSTNP